MHVVGDGRDVRVHLVEDHPDLAMLVRHLLEPTGIDLIHTGRLFATLLNRPPWQGVDVAIVDVLLGDPEIDGRDILRWLKVERPDIRRVVFSAVGNVYVELEELADVVLTKGSIGTAALLAAIGVDPDA